MDALLGELQRSLQEAARDIGERRNAVAQAELALQEREAELERGWRCLREREEEVAQLEGDAKRIRQSLEVEKQAMMKLGAGPNDIIGLSFGGEKVVKVKRSLLLQFEDSMLASMFSGRHDDTLDRDEQGNFFLDYSQNVMAPLIAFLRLNRDLPPQPVPLPEIPREDQTAWEAMVRFMGLEDVFFPPPAVFSGVRENVPIADLRGWALFFSRPYEHETTMEDFVPPDPALRGGALLVGARRAGSDVLSVAAMGNADVICAVTEDESTRLHNGAYWYCCREMAVGFSPGSRVDLDPADLDDEDSHLRLSWPLYGEGGYRAGCALDLYDSTEWEKVILAAPFRIPEGADDT